MTTFVITSSATSSLVYTGEPTFSRDASKAKTYATAAAAKRHCQSGNRHRALGPRRASHGRGRAGPDSGGAAQGATQEGCLKFPGGGRPVLRFPGQSGKRSTGQSFKGEPCSSNSGSR